MESIKYQDLAVGGGRCLKPDSFRVNGVINSMTDSALYEYLTQFEVNSGARTKMLKHLASIGLACIKNTTQSEAKDLSKLAYAQSVPHFLPADPMTEQHLGAPSQPKFSDVARKIHGQEALHPPAFANPTALAQSCEEGDEKAIATQNVPGGSRVPTGRGEHSVDGYCIDDEDFSDVDLPF